MTTTIDRRPLLRVLPTLLVGLFITIGLLSGCSPSGIPDGLSSTGVPLTAAQSEALASARLRLGLGGEFTVHVTSGAPDDTAHYAADLTVDPVSHRAWGTLSRGPQSLSVNETIAFTIDRYATEASGTWVVQPVEAAPGSGLFVVLSLSSDRPENAQLVQQAANRYLGTVNVNGSPLGVYQLATNTGEVGHTRMWLDEDGTFQRLDAGDDTLLVITRTTSPASPMPDEVDAMFGNAPTSGIGGDG